LSTTAIICGLVRQPGMALLQISNLAKLQAQGLIDQIVISTWEGELDRYPDVLDPIRKGRFTVVEAAEPRLKTPGYVLHQARTFQNALAACPDDAMVIKLRFDVMPIGPEYSRILSGRAWEEKARRCEPTHFRRPVWIHNGAPFFPFNHNDIVMYGHKLDLAKIADIDLKNEIDYATLAPEQFFHLAPFQDRNPLIRMFARIQRPMIAGDVGGNRIYAETLLQSPFWHRVWALNMRLLLENYYVGFRSDEEVYGAATMEAYERFSLTDLVMGREGMPGISYYPLSATTLFDSLSWAQAAAEGRFRQDAAGQMLAAAFMEAGSAGQTDSPVFPEPEVVELVEQLTKNCSFYSPKICREPATEPFRRLKADEARFGILQDGQEAEDLRREVNALRREVERLHHELAQARQR
jgi:hypothetical protein